jgi:hypothetical protein
VSDPVSYDVELVGDATREQLEELVAHVDAIAEIPNSVRQGPEVKLASPLGRSVARVPRFGRFREVVAAAWQPAALEIGGDRDELR